MFSSSCSESTFQYVATKEKTLDIFWLQLWTLLVLGSACLRSPDIRSVIPPIGDWKNLMFLMVRSNSSRAALCDIVHSSHRMNACLFITWVIPEVLMKPKIGLSDEVQSNGSLKVECYVRPTDSKLAAIPDEATIKVLNLYCPTLASFG